MEETLNTDQVALLDRDVEKMNHIHNQLNEHSNDNSHDNSNDNSNQNSNENIGNENFK